MDDDGLDEDTVGRISHVRITPDLVPSTLQIPLSTTRTAEPVNQVIVLHSNAPSNRTCGRPLLLPGRPVLTCVCVTTPMTHTPFTVGSHILECRPQRRLHRPQRVRGPFCSYRIATRGQDRLVSHVHSPPTTTRTKLATNMSTS